MSSKLKRQHEQLLKLVREGRLTAAAAEYRPFKTKGCPDMHFFFDDSCQGCLDNRREDEERRLVDRLRRELEKEEQRRLQREGREAARKAARDAEREAVWEDRPEPVKENTSSSSSSMGSDVLALLGWAVAGVVLVVFVVGMMLIVAAQWVVAGLEAAQAGVGVLVDWVAFAGDRAGPWVSVVAFTAVVVALVRSRAAGASLPVVVWGGVPVMLWWPWAAVLLSTGWFSVPDHETISAFFRIVWATLLAAGTGLLLVAAGKRFLVGGAGGDTTVSGKDAAGAG